MKTLLAERLKKLAQEIEEFKKVGVSEEILVPFICDRTKLPKRDVKKMLKSVDEFYNLLLRKVAEETAEEFEKAKSH
jgi:hypothetical protein